MEQLKKSAFAKNGISRALPALTFAAITLSGMDAVHATELDPEREQAQRPAAAPSLPISMGTGGDLTIARDALRYAIQGERMLFNLHAGLTSQDKRGLAIGGAQFGLSLGHDTALGTNLSLSPDKWEAVVGGVHDLQTMGVRLRAALSYMRGAQDFNFYRSTERADQ